VVRHGVEGCPLSRGGQYRLPDGSAFQVPEPCAWWDTSAGREELDHTGAEVVLIVGGLGDLSDRRLATWDGDRHLGEPDYDAWLVREIDALLDAFTATGARVVWIPPVCADWDRLRAFVDPETIEQRRLDFWHRIVPAVTGAREGRVVVADANPLLCPAGLFTDEVLGVPGARPDGIHLSREASTALAAHWLGPLLLQTTEGARG
jgi:hypothetical protein